MTVSHHHKINKTLFAAGQQCAKRLYLEHHNPAEVPQPPTTRQQLQAVGQQLLELAHQGFPKGTLIEEESGPEAAERTTEVLASNDGGALFNPCFIFEGTQIRCDVVLPSKEQRVDIFEVKAGTKIKQRHVVDVALQIYVLEKLGYEVGSASILHLDADYRHAGGRDYPAHTIFRNVEVTTKARKQVRRMKDLLANYQAILDDSSTLDLPTGTWCLAPIPCVFLGRCRGEIEGQPLIDLPELNKQQEFELHQAGIEELSQIEAARPGLSLMQRRALRAIQGNELVVAEGVQEELTDVDQPICIVTAEFYLQVMPTFANSRPWQHLPMFWNAIRVESDGATTHGSWQAEGKEDPRPQFVATLSQFLSDAGTAVLHNPRLDQVLRHIAEDLPESATHAKALLDHPAIELNQVLKSGVYHPDFPANFDIDGIAAALLDGHTFDDLEISNKEQATVAMQKLLQSRTRAATRQKIGEQLEHFGRRHAEGILGIYRTLASND